MHPYSEFIQDDIYKKNRLDKSGKIKMILGLLIGAGCLENTLLMKFLKSIIG